VLNTETTQRERRKVVQVTLLPSVYRIAQTKADEHGTHPGRIIEWALLQIQRGKSRNQFSDAASLGRDRNRPDF
jgi:hypothetical protein